MESSIHNGLFVFSPRRKIDFYSAYLILQIELFHITLFAILACGVSKSLGLPKTDTDAENRY